MRSLLRRVGRVESSRGEKGSRKARTRQLLGHHSALVRGPTAACAFRTA